jgi:hypothetical protein
MKRFVAVVALFATGCSLLFDPAKVRYPDAGGGDGGLDGGAVCPASCPTLSKTTATCGDAGQCVLSCQAGFADTNDDLADGGTTGCELACSSAPPPQSPPILVASVGPPGQVDLFWPEPDGGSLAYQLCLGTDAGGNCGLAPSSLLCLNGICGASFSGLPNNVRFVATVLGSNFCSLASPSTQQSTSFTPVNSHLVNGFDGFDVDSSCSALPVVTTTDPPEVRVEQTGASCLTLLNVGDELWGDSTIQVEVRIPAPTDVPLFAGILQQTGAAGHVVSAGTAKNLFDADTFSSVNYRATGASFPALAATSLYRLPPNNTWVTVRLVAARGVFSFQFAPDPAGPYTELIRWPSPLPGAATQTGRPGLVVYGAGKAHFRNLRVTTLGMLPPRGPTSVSYPLFGNALPTDWVFKGLGTVTGVACPNLGEATNCQVDGGCRPGPGQGCANLKRVLTAGPSASFNFPTGIDVAQPWRMSMRFAALDAGFNSPVILKNGHGSVLEVPGFASVELTTMTIPLGYPLELSRWHHAEWTFHADAGIELSFDRQPPRWVPRPGPWDRHPGVLTVGASGGAYDLYVTDINVSQP